MEPRSDAVKRQEELRDFMMDFWLRLQAERRVNITQNELANIVGWSVNVMSRVMRASGLPSLENTIQASKVVGPEIFDIIGYPRLAYDDPEFRVVMETWPTLSQDERRKIVANLKAGLSSDERAHAPDHNTVAAS